MKIKLIIILLTFIAQIMPCQAATITDQSGQVVKFNKPFSRIISLYAAHTENLFALGLDKNIIGVSKHDDFPVQATAKPKFYYRDDPEKFIAAHPDLVLIRPMIAHGYPDLAQKLRLAGITVISLQPTSIAETYQYWLKLGELCGRTEAARAMVQKFREKLQEIAAIVNTIPTAHRKKVYFEAIHRRMKTFTPTSMAIFCLETAGGINVAPEAKSVRKTNIAAFGKEHILAKAKDIDVFLAQTGRMNKVTITDIKNEPGFKAINAIRQNQIYLINEELVSRPTIRLLQGIDQIGTILYPAKFNEIH